MYPVERMLFRGLVAQHPCRLQGFGHPRLPALRLPRAYRSGSPQSPATGLTRATARGARGRRPLLLLAAGGAGALQLAAARGPPPAAKAAPAAASGEEAAVAVAAVAAGPEEPEGRAVAAAAGLSLWRELRELVWQHLAALLLGTSALVLAAVLQSSKVGRLTADLGVLVLQYDGSVDPGKREALLGTLWAMLRWQRAHTVIRSFMADRDKNGFSR